MNTIALDETELATILAALRLFRFTRSDDVAELPREQAKKMTSIFATELMTSDTGEPIAMLEPADIDDLLDRLKSA